MRKIACEYYEEVPQLKSYVQVLYDFIFDPEIGKSFLSYLLNNEIVLEVVIKKAFWVCKVL